MRPQLLLAAVLMTLGGCVQRDQEKTRTWEPLANSYATHFTILGSGDERRLIVFGHGGTADTVSDVRIDSALQRIATISTTHAAFISALGGTDRIVATAQADQVRDPALREAIAAGRVLDIGTADGLDREKLIALKPDAVLGYPFGGESGTLKSMGIPVVQISEYLEEHPLGRAEWIRFFGVLLGKEREADSLFNGIVVRYEEVRKSVPRDTLPTVLFGSVWQGQWFVPPGNSYMAKLIEDAGGRYLFADRKGDGNITLDMETMIKEGSQADVWGMVTDEQTSMPWPELFTKGDERIDRFKSVQTTRLFVGNSTKADLFGKALLEPDLMLGDLRNILNPLGALDTTWHKTYFRRYYDLPPNIITGCPVVDEPRTQ